MSNGNQTSIFDDSFRYCDLLNGNVKTSIKTCMVFYKHHKKYLDKFKSPLPDLICKDGYKYNLVTIVNQPVGKELELLNSHGGVDWVETLHGSTISTDDLVDILILTEELGDGCTPATEAKLALSFCHTTHWIYIDSEEGIIYDTGCDDEEVEWKIEEFKEHYKDAIWGIDTCNFRVFNASEVGE